MAWFRHDPMDTVEKALKNRGWKYQRVDSKTVLSGFALQQYTCFVGIQHEEERKTLVFLFHPARTPMEVFQAVTAGGHPFVRVHTSMGHSEEQVAQVCALLLHENHSMLLGSFERDEADGEIRFRVALPYRDVHVTVEQVNWCVEIGVFALDSGMQKIQAILGGKAIAERTVV
jgi:hypothetical protein